MTAFNALPRDTRVSGRYLVGDVIGRGRSATVYEALDLVTGVAVALKALDPRLVTDARAVERFRREAAAIARLAHPHVIAVTDVISTPALHAIVMERFPGLNGKELVRQRGPLAVSAAVRAGEMIAQAVAACHRAGVLHRDLKPQNVMIEPRLGLKIVDFGVAKLTAMADLTRTGTVLGTPEYMPPEMFLAARADPRSDVYGIGAILYELLTGRPPVRAQSVAEAVGSLMRGLIEPLRSTRPEIPEWLDLVVRRCLALDPNDRYQSCQELLADLRRGPEAMAVHIASLARLTCRRCQAELIRGLPLCHACGNLLSETYSSGPFTVVLNAVADVKATANSVADAFDVAPKPLARGFSSLPRPLASGMSEQTAGAVAQELSMHGCVVQVSRDLKREFRIKGVLVPLALSPPFGAIVFVLIQEASLATVLISSVLGIAIAWLAFLARSRPLIDLRRRFRQHDAAPDPLVNWLVNSLQPLKDANLRYLVGLIGLRLMRVRHAATKDPAPFPVDLAALVRVADRCLVLAHTLEGLEIYLDGRSATDLREKLNYVEKRLSRTANTAESETLITQRAALAAQLTRHRDALDAHAAMTMSLLRFAAFLEELDERTNPAALEQELSVIEQTLEAA